MPGNRDGGKHPPNLQCLQMTENEGCHCRQWSGRHGSKSSHRERRDNRLRSPTKTRFPTIWGQTMYSDCSPKLEQVHASRSTNMQTYFAILENPPKNASSVGEAWGVSKQKVIGAIQGLNSQYYSLGLWYATGSNRGWGGGMWCFPKLQVCNDISQTQGQSGRQGFPQNGNSIAFCKSTSQEICGSSFACRSMPAENGEGSPHRRS